MKNAASLALAVVVALGSFAAGVRWARRPAAAPGQRSAAAWSCPMHPQYRSDRPGDCPSCGMKLEALREKGSGAAPAGLPPGALQVSPERQQTIGVRLGVAEPVSGTRTLRTTGRVVPNENAVYPLVAGAEGLVREVRGATTGALVRRNEVLLAFYSPEFITAQQSYLAGLETLGRPTSDQLQGFVPGRLSDSVERFANTLRNLGVSEQQLAEMRTKRQLSQLIQVVSPVDGFVLARNASVGLRVDRGFEFYRVADLRSVWVMADVYQSQAPFIRAGSKAVVSSQEAGRQLEARTSRAEPTFDEAARTLKVRLETPNPGFALKPGMFVDVRFDIELPASLAVPAEAIVDSGLRKTVYVDRGNGYFEPRAVETGWRIGDQVEVTRGLMAGERIVISGTFLIDSESRMKMAGQRTAGTPPSSEPSMAAPAAADVDPMCGMEVDAEKQRAVGRTSEHEGRTYFFCSDDCKKRFDADPAKHARAR